jgi:xylulokinase
VGGSPLFVAVEVGTTGARAVAFDRRGRLVAEAREPYDTSMPRAGWVEQDAAAWAENAVTALVTLGRHVNGQRVAAIGLTGQSPSVVPVDEQCRPLRPGMLYKDNRAVAEAAELIDLFGAEKLHRLTGHTPMAFHVGPKILWLRRHEPDVFEEARWFLQPRDVVLHRLTGKVATDQTHANATGLSDIRARDWAGDLLVALDLDARRFPDVMAPSAIAELLSSDIAAAAGIPTGTPVVIGAGDSQCAAFGAGVTASGPISEMAGSSSCFNSAVREPVADLRVTNYSHVVPAMFTTEVGLNTTGAALRWVVHSLGFGSYRQLERAAEVQRARMAGIGPARAVAAAPRFFPHLGDGERDDTSACGRLDLLSERHDAAAIAFAVLEGVAAAVATEVEVLREAGSPLTELRASGGGTRIPLLGQLKADLLGVPVVHLAIDASALGAAMLAAVSAGFDDIARTAIDAALSAASRFEPDAAAAPALAARLASWRSA